MKTAIRPDASASVREQVQLVLIAALGALVSLIATGHMVGVRNDIYFQPILAALFNKPQFANDAYVQSLHYYSSGLWQLLSGVDAYVEPYWLLLGLHFVSRMLTFLGFLACATLLGVTTLQQRLFLTGLLCITSFLRGQSLAGDGGLFINYFTHSEVNNGLTLLILFMLLRGWLIAAIATDGIVFFLNAFIGVWDAVMIIGVATAMAARGVMTWRRFILHGTIGTVLAAIPAFPILQDIFSNPDFGHAFGFDYVDYLKEFWPYHFLFEAISLREKAGLGAIVVLGAAAFVAMGRRSFFFLVALASLGLVYAIGIAIPFVTHSAVVLNLHLLRVSTILQLLAILGCLTLATRWWFLGKPLEARLLAPALVLIMCVPIKMTTIQPALHAGAAFLLIVAALSPTARQRIPDWLFSPKLRLQFWVGAIVVTGFLIVTARNAVSNIQAGEWLSEWKAVGQWAKSNTSPTDVFLVPTWSFQGSPSQDRTSEDTEAILNSGAFEAVSDRAVWIDFRQGAAVMWSPSNYAQWHRRVAEVNSLASPTARQEYARAHGIKYLIEVCRQDPPHTPLFSTKRLCVYDAS